MNPRYHHPLHWRTLPNRQASCTQRANRVQAFFRWLLIAALAVAASMVAGGLLALLENALLP